jgi:hypothetical protein
MTFHLRSLSARRYRVEGDLLSVGDAAFARRLSDHAFRPLSANEERAFGWVTADNCLDTHFETGGGLLGPCAVFALRVDRRRVNGRLLRARVDLEVRGAKKDADRDAEGAGDHKARRPGGRLSREERQEIRRRVSEELLAATPPSMEVHSVLLYPRDRVVLFGSLSRPANEVFRALFADTFDVTLAALTPYHRALELLRSRGGGEALAPLRRADFGTRARAVDALPSPVLPGPIAARVTPAQEVLR